MIGHFLIFIHINYQFEIVYTNISNLNHDLKNSPMANPIAVMTDPNKRVYIPDFHLLRPIIAAFAKPKLKSSITPIHMTGIGCCVSSLRIPDEIT